MAIPASPEKGLSPPAASGVLRGGGGCAWWWSLCGAMMRGTQRREGRGCGRRFMDMRAKTAGGAGGRGRRAGPAGGGCGLEGALFSLVRAALGGEELLHDRGLDVVVRVGDRGHLVLPTAPAPLRATKASTSTRVGGRNGWADQRQLRCMHSGGRTVAVSRRDATMSILQKA